MGFGSVSLLLGAMMTPLLMAMGFEYDTGPGRTNWIEPWAFGVSLPAHLVALVVVGAGLVIMRRRDRAATVRAQRVLVLGAALGAATMLLLQLALAFDLAGLSTQEGRLVLSHVCQLRKRCLGGP
jgi:cytochrome c biogenesis factor